MTTVLLESKSMEIQYSDKFDFRILIFYSLNFWSNKVKFPMYGNLSCKTHAVQYPVFEMEVLA